MQQEIICIKFLRKKKYTVTSQLSYRQVSYIKQANLYSPNNPHQRIKNSKRKLISLQRKTKVNQILFYLLILALQ